MTPAQPPDDQDFLASLRDDDASEERFLGARRARLDEPLSPAEAARLSAALREDGLLTDGARVDGRRNSALALVIDGLAPRTGWVIDRFGTYDAEGWLAAASKLLALPPELGARAIRIEADLDDLRVRVAFRDGADRAFLWEANTEWYDDDSIEGHEALLECFAERAHAVVPGWFVRAMWNGREQVFYFPRATGDAFLELKFVLPLDVPYHVD